jgi:hypothetical protein
MSSTCSICAAPICPSITSNGARNRPMLAAAADEIEERRDPGG